MSATRTDNEGVGADHPLRCCTCHKVKRTSAMCDDCHGFATQVNVDREVAARDEEIARLREMVHARTPVDEALMARVAQLEAALRELEDDYTILPGGSVIGHCGKCHSEEWLNGDLCHATTCAFGALTKELP